MRYDYKTIHPCGPHDVEMWISFLLDPNIILKENVLRDFKFKRRILSEKFGFFHRYPLFARNTLGIIYRLWAIYISRVMPFRLVYAT